jgi:ferredoxin-NADP reductase
VPLLTLPIVDARQETPRNRIIHVGLGSNPFPFEAGQYVRLGQHGGSERRPYSIACAPAYAARLCVLEFLIQVGDDGSPGPHLPTLEVGDRLDVEGPDGSFVLPTGRLPRDILFVAGGTGIAPLRAMLFQIIDAGAETRIGLVQSGRTPDELAYANEFRELADARRIHLVETVTRDAPGSWQGIRGRIGRAHLEAAMTGPGPLCFVCGPDSLVADVPRQLAELAVPPSRIFTEHWADQATGVKPASLPPADSTSLP